MKATTLPPILCIGFPAWEGDYQKSTVQLMQALARQQRVLYVEYPFSWKDVWQGLRDRNRPWLRILGLKLRLRSMSYLGRGDLHVLTLPPMLPINGLAPGWLYERMAQVNAAVAAWTIKRALRQLQFARPVMINANNPFLGAYLTPQLDLRRAYYYCYDEIGATRWTYRHGPRLEQQLLAQVDGVMASSQALLEVKGAGHAPAQRLLLRNGANVDLFGQAFTEVLPDHAAGPVLGYLGSIDDRIDVDLLLSLMNQWPEARLLMVGRITDASTGDRLGQHPRIELAGPQPPDQLPTWLKRMHLGLIPFVANAFTRYIYPLKINEYLAAGLPVVSTDFSDLSEFTAVAHIAASGPPFLRACQQAWQEDSPAQRKMRRIFAQEQSWRGRALTLTSWLSGQLGRPAAGPSSRIMPVERRPNDCPLLITQLSQLPPTPQHP